MYICTYLHSSLSKWLHREETKRKLLIKKFAINKNTILQKSAMTDQSMLDNTISMKGHSNPHESALQSLCKQLLKSRLFRGYYLERRYVEGIKEYRDLVCLEKSEKVLDKMLRDIRDKLQLSYSCQNPNIWIGITSGSLTGISNPPPAALETYLWVELQDLAFREYWFRIKSIRFRDNEIVIKLKVVQPVEQENISSWSLNSNNVKESCEKNIHPLDASTDLSDSDRKGVSTVKKQVTVEDFSSLLQQWWMSTKQTVYAFMAEDISKENIKAALRFLGLLFIAILSSTLVGLEFLGNFTLRFMHEFSRLTYVLTPIILKMVEVFSKIIGGFYILLAMIWKDAVGNRNQPKHTAIEYHRPMLMNKSIDYEARQKPLESSPTVTSFEKISQ